MSKQHKTIDLSEFSTDERCALEHWLRQMQAKAPEMQSLRDTAKDTFEAFVNTPEWTIRDAEKPDGTTPSEPPKLPEVTAEINYVDYIEPIGGDE